MRKAPERRLAAARPTTPAVVSERLEREVLAACQRSARLAGRTRAAALLTSKGEVFQGVDLPDPEETGVGACAERVALYEALAARGGRATHILLRAGRGGSRDAGSPCGICLQVLYEHAPRARIHWGTKARPAGGLTVAELLPGAFGPLNLRTRGRA